MRKDSGTDPVSSCAAFYGPITEQNASLFGCLMNSDTDDVLQVSGNGKIIGTAGSDVSLEGFGVNLSSGEIRYRAYCQTCGWKNWCASGNYAGTTGEGKRLEAVQIELTGNMAKLYDVYYRTSVQKFGWLDWTKNGEIAGSSGYSCGIEALQVQLVAKSSAGPAVGSHSMIQKNEKESLMNPCPGAVVSSEFGPRVAPVAGASTYHKGIDLAAAEGTAIYAAATGKVVTVSSSKARGNYLIIDHQNGIKTLYQHCSKIIAKEGDTVFVGKKIAEVGSTGYVSGAHLHFEVWMDDVPVNPRLYLDL